MSKEKEMRTAERIPSLTNDEKEQMERTGSVEPTKLQDDFQIIARNDYRFVPKLSKPHPESLMKIKDVLNYRFLIKGMIGKGGYGQIYRARDLKDNVDVAMKAEPTTLKGKLQKRMILEQMALMRLQGRPHVPRMIASGLYHNTTNYIILQLLSMNVGDLKAASPVGKLGSSTVARIMIQAISGLRDLHTYGYLHRDIKPANMCFGVTPNERHILKIVDFGMVRFFRNRDGRPCKLRRKAGFRGTLRYASLRVHEKVDQSPPDDLVSLAYSTVELLLGNVPWRCENDGRAIKKAKQQIACPSNTSSALNMLRDPFDMFCWAILSLNAGDEPNYEALQNILFEATMHKGLSALYDWEEDYIDALKEEGVFFEEEMAPTDI